MVKLKLDRLSVLFKNVELVSRRDKIGTSEFWLQDLYSELHCVYADQIYADPFHTPCVYAQMIFKLLSLKYYKNSKNI